MRLGVFHGRFSQALPNITFPVGLDCKGHIDGVCPAFDGGGAGIGAAAFGISKVSTQTEFFGCRCWGQEAGGRKGGCPVTIYIYVYMYIYIYVYIYINK